MTQAPPARSRSRFFTIVVPLAAVAAAVAAAAACSQSLRANGEDCLKDQDCLSGFCAQSQCRPAPALLDAEVNADGFGADAGDATTTDGPASGDSAPKPEGSMPSEAGAEAATDGGNRSDGGLVDGSAEAGAQEGGVTGEAGSPEAGTPESGPADSAAD